MKVFIERDNKTIECTAKTGTELLAQLKINPVTVLLARNDTIILPEESLDSSDDIAIISVISGG